MQNSDNGILGYGALISFIEISINNMKSIGIDSSKFELKLKAIESETNDKLSLVGDASEVDKSRNLDKVYAFGVNKLTELLKEINKNKAFYQTINKGMYVFNAQNVYDLSEKEISELVDDVIENLNTIKLSRNFVEELEVIEKLYELAFNVIKLEYRVFGTSKLALYCKKNEIDTIYISKYVIKEIEEIGRGNFDTSEIESLVKKIKSSDDFSLYLDDKLLSILSYAKNADSYINELIVLIDQLNKAIAKNNKDFEKLGNEEENLGNQKYKHKLEIKRKKEINRRNIRKPVIVLGVTVGVLSSLIAGGIELSKVTEYMTTVETLSSNGADENEIEEYRRKLKYDGSDVTELTTINIYEPWVKNDRTDIYNRVIKSVDISDIDYEDLRQYLDLDLENLGYKYSETKETKEILALEDLYTEDIEEVIKQVQDTSVEREGSINIYENPGTGILIFSIYAVGLYIYLVFEAIKEDWLFGIIQSIRRIIREVKYKKDTTYEKKEIAYITNKIIEIKKQMEDLISSNEEYKKKYDNIMSQPKNKKLLENYEKSIKILQEYASTVDKSEKLTLSKKSK